MGSNQSFELGNGSISSIRSAATANLVSRLATAGKPNKTIYRELQMSDGTVKAHINAIYRNPGAVYTAEAALAA